MSSTTGWGSEGCAVGKDKHKAIYGFRTDGAAADELLPGRFKRRNDDWHRARSTF